MTVAMSRRWTCPSAYISPLGWNFQVNLRIGSFTEEGGMNWKAIRGILCISLTA